MKKKQLIKILLTVLLCAAIIMSCLMPVFASEEKGGETLTVGVPTDRCPIFYHDADNYEIVGIGVDLMRIAAEKAGFKVVFKEIEEETLKDALDNTEYDLIMPFGSAIKSSSGKASIVSENLLQTPFTLVTEGNRKLPELNSLRVGMLSSLGGAAETVKQLYPGIEIVLYETVPECVKALRKDSVDALLHNSYVWSYILQTPSYSDLKVQPTAMFSMDFRVGALDTQRGRQLIELLNQGIAALADTNRQAVILDYTSRRLYRYDLSDYLYEYGLILLLTSLLIISIIIISVQKRQKYRLEQEEKMREMIDHDALTGTLSMTGFRKRVEELLKEHPDIPYMLAYSNIRNFKFINDSMGRETGDELLRFWADKTAGTLTDEEAVARLDSDHLAVLRIMAGEERLHSDDADVVDLVRTYFTDHGRENRVQVCGGVYVLTPEDYQNIDVDHMLDLARVAEKRVRETRKDGYAFYNPDQWEKGKWTADIISHLKNAIKAKEIQVWYQPQVDYEKGEIIGAEALCRWNHAKLGWLSPAKFIPTLEDAGLIYELDRYIWDRVCQDLKRWNDQGIRRSVSINLSRCDIRENQDIPGHFAGLIEKYGLGPEQLRIEITETAYVENPSLLIDTTDRLRKRGFTVEMDDFGSGYSSLHMLKEVSVDRIKMDLYFLTETGDPERGRTIVSCIIQMGQLLGVNLIAEGVETAEQAKFLLEIGCKEMQGYYFYKPMPVEEFEKLKKKI